MYAGLLKLSNYMDQIFHFFVFVFDIQYIFQNSYFCERNNRTEIRKLNQLYNKSIHLKSQTLEFK